MYWFNSAIMLCLHKRGCGFPTSYGVFLMFNELMREEFFRFVDISGIVDHHCLIFWVIISFKGPS